MTLPFLLIEKRDFFYLSELVGMKSIVEATLEVSLEVGIFKRRDTTQRSRYL